MINSCVSMGGRGYDCEQVETCSESDVLSKHCEIQVGVVCGIQVGAVMIGSLLEMYNTTGL